MPAAAICRAGELPTRCGASAVSCRPRGACSWTAPGFEGQNLLGPGQGSRAHRFPYEPDQRTQPQDRGLTRSPSLPSHRARQRAPTLRRTQTSTQRRRPRVREAPSLHAAYASALLALHGSGTAHDDRSFWTGPPDLEWSNVILCCGASRKQGHIEAARHASRPIRQN